MRSGILLGACGAALCAPAPAAQVTAIRAGHLIDTDAARVLEGQTIVVTGGVISAVGAAPPLPAGAQLIDLSGYWVLPGLMDAHTHLTIGSSNQDPLAQLEHTAAERALRS